MQVRAIASAARHFEGSGPHPRPEIMVPLVSMTTELAQLRSVIERVIDDVERENTVELDIPIGTTIELPRACVTANERAQHALLSSFAQTT